MVAKTSTSRDFSDELAVEDELEDPLEWGLLNEKPPLVAALLTAVELPALDEEESVVSPHPANRMAAPKNVIVFSK
jgi:hypothetical protein